MPSIGECKYCGAETTNGGRGWYDETICDDCNKQKEEANEKKLPVSLEVKNNETDT